MEMRYPPDPEKVKGLSTRQLREAFLMESLFVPGQVQLLYSHADRMIVGGACPDGEKLALAPSPNELGTRFFLERREMGVVNVGGPGSITANGSRYPIGKLDALYIGSGTKEALFESDDPQQPAHFYLCSAPAHVSCPTTPILSSQAEPVHLGSIDNSNERTIYKYIHPAGVGSCQLVLGVTLLKPGNMWNTMPAHVHSRRMEVYMYFDLPDNSVVFHLMGEPHETRHIVVRNEQAVISPSWSIHAGVGTCNYGFVWAMAGENQDFADMDPVTMAELR